VFSAVALTALFAPALSATCPKRADPHGCNVPKKFGKRPTKPM
jgi:hypothetical protein